VAQRGAIALTLAREFKPTAISLDVSCPTCSLDGPQQSEARAFHPAHTRADRHLRGRAQHGLSHGAFDLPGQATTTEGIEASFARLKEFAQPHTKRLLVVEIMTRNGSASSICSATAISKSPAWPPGPKLSRLLIVL